MSGVSSRARTLARQVLFSEAGSDEDPALTAAADRVGVRLGERFATLFGSAGYQALLSRAVRLARADVPDLRQVTVDGRGKGGLRGLSAFAEGQGDDAGTVAVGFTAIFAHLFELLITFIGEPLTVRLLREGWPELGDAERGLEEQP